MQWSTPCRALAAPPLAGFLAYDLVLFVPYARLLTSDAGTGAVDDYYGSGLSAGINVMSLIIYLGVLSLSALLALYLFFVDPRTRWFGRVSHKPT